MSEKEIDHLESTSTKSKLIITETTNISQKNLDDSIDVFTLIITINNL